MRKPKPHSPAEAAEPTEAEIQKVAYRLWVEGGCLEGVEIDNWHAAREVIRHHHGAAHAPGKHRPAVTVRSS
ncbi:MAG: DUF2934 domain-containing protein [Opitutaceae bacterium]|nr:DUF2934 domain-containing protein [Opitutaceae bacterium]